MSNKLDPMGFLRKIVFVLFIGLIVSCSKDEVPSAPETRTTLTATELQFIEEYEYVTFNLSPTSFGADRNEKWQSNINIFLDGEITEAYRTNVSEALVDFNSLFTDNGIRAMLVESMAAANIHLIYGEKVAIETIWPDMYQAIGTVNFEGYALYNRDQNFNITSGRIWVSNARIPLFKHELGHIIGLGHASSNYCESDFSRNRSFMCSFLKEEFSTFDQAMIQTLYSSEIEVGKTFAELKPLIENLLLAGKVRVDE